MSDCKQDLTNIKFGRLTAIKKIGKLYDNRMYWLCKCDCGKESNVSYKNLQSGLVKSCGCSFKGINTGSKHGLWKGDNVSYEGLHNYIRRHIVKSNKCSMCGKNKKLDMANISGEYKRDLSDWEWLCRRCHMISDGRYFKYSLRFNKKTI